MTYPIQRGRDTAFATSNSRLVVEHSVSQLLAPTTYAVSRRRYGITMGRSLIVAMSAPPPPPPAGSGQSQYPAWEAIIVSPLA